MPILMSLSRVLIDVQELVIRQKLMPQEVLIIGNIRPVIKL